MIPLPLTPAMNRCLAHGYQSGTRCERSDHCARHITIGHDTTPLPAAFRACSSDLMAMYVPIEGFPKRDAEEA